MAGCKHCDLDVPTDSATDDFCCFGCEAAWHLIRDSGLQSYYQKRVLDPISAACAPMTMSLSIRPRSSMKSPTG